MISAVDLIKGIGIFAGLEVLEVQGATGNIDTNFEGKAEAAIDAYKEARTSYTLHMEGHRRVFPSGRSAGQDKMRRIYRQPSGKTDSRLSERNRREIQGAGGS